jgi:hypothetical protein
MIKIKIVVKKNLWNFNHKGVKITIFKQVNPIFACLASITGSACF